MTSQPAPRPGDIWARCSSGRTVRVVAVTPSRVEWVATNPGHGEQRSGNPFLSTFRSHYRHLNSPEEP